MNSLLSLAAALALAAAGAADATTPAQLLADYGAAAGAPGEPQRGQDFFRSIVRRIAAVHGVDVRVQRSTLGGLGVSLRAPLSGLAS